MVKRGTRHVCIMSRRSVAPPETLDALKAAPSDVNIMCVVELAARYVGPDAGLFCGVLFCGVAIWQRGSSELLSR